MRSAAPMVRQIESAWWNKLNGLLRYLLLYHLPVFNGSLVVNEFPKSGGTWLTRLLSDSLALPFAEHRLPHFGNQIFQGHFIRRGLKKKTVLLWRDGRDVLVSQYYHSLFYNRYGNRSLVDRTRADLKFSDFSDVKANLHGFLEYLNQGRGFPRYTWSAFVDVWHNEPSALHLKYENLFDEPEKSLDTLLKQVGTPLAETLISGIVERHRLKPKNHDKSAGQDSDYVPHARKGGYGGWREVFTATTARKFREVAGEQLLLLGYETDHNWVDELVELELTHDS